MSDKQQKNNDYRGVMDEIREQHHKLRNRPFKEKLAYFWEYYKIHTLVVVLLLTGIIYFIHSIVTSKDYCFYAVMLNSQPLSSDAIEQSFADYAALDSAHYDCYIDTDTTLGSTDSSEAAISQQAQYDMVVMQKLIAITQTNELDAVVFNDSVFETYAQNEMFMDLRTVLTEADLEKYADALLYVDYESQQHVPVGIYLDNSPFVKKSGCYYDTRPVFGISLSSQHSDTAVTYLHYLFDETIPFDEMLKMPLQ